MSVVLHELGCVKTLVSLSLVERYFCDVCSFVALKPEPVKQVNIGAGHSLRCDCLEVSVYRAGAGEGCID